MIPSSLSHEARAISEVLSSKYGITDSIRGISELSWGRMNLTYRVDLSDISLVVQRILDSDGRNDRDMTRYFVVQEELRSQASRILLPTVLLDSDGRSVTEHAWARWHVQKYLKNDPVECLTPELAHSAGKLLWELRLALDGWVSGNEPLWQEEKACPDHSLDDAWFYSNWRALERAIETHASHPFADEVRSWMPELVEGKKLYETLRIPIKKWVIHADAKLANILFRDGEAVGFVDPDNFVYTDTIWELGQMLRSFASKWVDSKTYDPLIIRATLDGYNSARDPDDRLTFQEWLSWVFYQALNLIIRFATDTLEEKTFRWDHSRGFSTASEQHRADFLMYRDLYREIVHDIRLTQGGNSQVIIPRNWGVKKTDENTGICP